MTTLPILPVVLPSHLVGVENGRLPDTLLRTVGPAGGRLFPLAARCWVATWVAAKAAGVDLTYSPGGTYRTLSAQGSLFTERWTTTPLPGRPTTFYAGARWWLKVGKARAARPGTSNHGLGLAIDVASGTEPKNAQPLTPNALRWLIANAVSLGWSWETVPSEPWHLRMVTGDNLPQRVLDIEQYLRAQEVKP